MPKYDSHLQDCIRSFLYFNVINDYVILHSFFSVDNEEEEEEEEDEDGDRDEDEDYNPESDAEEEDEDEDEEEDEEEDEDLESDEEDESDDGSMSPSGPWGSEHPEIGKVMRPKSRVFFSDAENEYIKNFIQSTPTLGACDLYLQIKNCSYARAIFHPHHIEIKERIDSKYKEVRNKLYNMD